MRTTTATGSTAVLLKAVVLHLSAYLHLHRLCTVVHYNIYFFRCIHIKTQYFSVVNIKYPIVTKFASNKKKHYIITQDKKYITLLFAFANNDTMLLANKFSTY